jgi:hypothetical protein
MRQPHHERQQNAHEGVDVLDRIPGETAELIRCWIALLEGSVSMGILVRDHREEQRRKSQDEILKSPQVSLAKDEM